MAKRERIEDKVLTQCPNCGKVKSFSAWWRTCRMGKCRAGGNPFLKRADKNVRAPLTEGRQHDPSIRGLAPTQGDGKEE